MITIRKSEERGYFDHGWLKTYHTFSFADYHDPNYVQFRSLRVINEDRVGPGEGFENHFHSDMEIITYVLSGSLEHKDSMGNTSVICPGEVQRMSAGAGVTHSEFNPSEKEAVHLLQIWIFPADKNLPPSYEQKFFDVKGKTNQLRLVASQNGDQGSVAVHQNALVYDCLLEKGKSLTHELKPDRGVWVQVTKGELVLDGNVLKEGDSASAEKGTTLQFSSNKETEFLLFDLA